MSSALLPLGFCLPEEEVLLSGAFCLALSREEEAVLWCRSPPLYTFRSCSFCCKSSMSFYLRKIFSLSCNCSCSKSSSTLYLIFLFSSTSSLRSSDPLSSFIISFTLLFCSLRSAELTLDRYLSFFSLFFDSSCRLSLALSAGLIPAFSVYVSPFASQFADFSRSCFWASDSRLSCDDKGPPSRAKSSACAVSSEVESMWSAAIDSLERLQKRHVHSLDR